MDEMGNNFYNIEKEIELYANKLHNSDQRIEVSSFYNILLLLKNRKHKSCHSCCDYNFLFLCWKRNKKHTY